MDLILTLLGILFIHFIADFAIQTDWQAKNKSKNNWALFKHVFTYSATFAAAILVMFSIFVFNHNNFLAAKWFEGGALFVGVTFATHFITDYFTSRLNTKLWEAGRVHDFFCSIGFDQFLHNATLFLTFYWIFLK